MKTNLFTEPGQVNTQVIRYVNRTKEPHGMYARSERTARTQCRNCRIASGKAMTGSRIMILLYGAGGEPGRGEIPMRLQSMQSSDGFPNEKQGMLRTNTAIYILRDQ